MLGNFESEPFSSGRGAKVRDRTVAALATLHAILGLDPESLRLHKEDLVTTHRCPGSNVKKADMIQRVHELLEIRHAGEHALEEEAAG